MSNEEIPVSESISNFNLYSVELRAKIDGILKQVLIVSGGIQAITIGAFLSGKAPALPVEVISLLKLGWFSLSISIICCLSLMLLQILTMVQVGFKQVKKMESPKSGIEIMNAWLPLRIFSWLVGLSAFFSCIIGVFIVSKAAMALIGSSGAV